MGTIAYWDCPTGIAGDMCLGALVSAGVPLEYLQDVVQKLGLELQVKLWTETIKRCGIEALKMHVEIIEIQELEPHPKPSEPPKKIAKVVPPVSDPDKETIAIAALSVFESDIDLESYAQQDHDHHDHDHLHDHVPHHAPLANPHPHKTHRHLPEIEQMIRNAKLPKQVEIWSIAVFRELAIAEGLVHGIAPEQVHFHEVGALDAIVDIVCTCAGLAYLGVEQTYCSPLPAGGGYVHCDHGIMPVPAPATLKLWENHAVTIFDNGIRKELVTPTGAAIAVTLSESFGEVPLMTIKKVGLGAGSQDLEIPNILRLWLGSSKKKA
jgi:uncharacterized protein (DUF111 family)